MKKFFTPLMLLALAAALVRAEEPKVDQPQAAKIASRCQADKLDALFKESNPMVKDDLKGFVTTGNALRVPENDEKVNLGREPKGNSLCPDEVWRYLLRDDKRLRSASLQDQIRIMLAANTAFQQVDELVAKVRQAAAEVYVQASTMDVINVAKKPVSFGYQAPVEVQEVAPKTPHPVMDPSEYEAALLSIIRPKGDSDVAVPGNAIQSFYKSLLDLRAKLRELKVGTYSNEPGLKDEFKTPETMHQVMQYVADCDFSRSDAEKGKKLNCWTAKKYDSDETLGNLDLFSRNFVGSHLAQTTFVYARAVALVEKVGPDGKKRTIRDLLKEFAKLKEENKVGRMNLKLLDFNHVVFQNLGKSLFGDKGVDDLRVAWESHDQAWRDANPNVKKAIDAVDGLQGAQLSGGMLFFKDNDKEVLYGKDIDVLAVKPDEINGVSSRVADNLLKGNKWGAIFQAAKAAVFGEPKKEEPKKEEPKKEEPKKEEPKKEQPKKELPKKEQPKKEQPKKEQPKKEEPKTAPVEVSPLPENQSTWEKVVSGAQTVLYGPMEAAKRSYMRTLADKSASDTKTRMASQEQRKKTLMDAKAARDAVGQDADQNPFLNDSARARQKKEAEEAYQKVVADAKKAEAAEQAQQAKDQVTLKAWADQANAKLLAEYDKRLLELAPVVAQTYKNGGGRHDALAAETGTGKYLTDELVQEYFDKDWSGDTAKGPLKANLAACQKAHGFSPQAGAMQQSKYVSPSEATFNSKCAHDGLVAYINGQKGKRGK
jgi:hypothetical protein